MTAVRFALLGAVVVVGCGMVGAAPAAATPTPSAPVPLMPPSTGSALLGAGQQIISGNPSGAVSTALGGGAGTLAASATSLGLEVIGSAVVGAAAAVLGETAAALGTTTAPQLESTWFSTTYWRMAAIAAVLTLPFLFAATVQAALRSDVVLLTRAAFGYLPLAMLSIAIAAPITSLLLAASDQLCGVISAAAGHESAHILAYAASVVAGLSAFGQSPFFAVLIGLFAIGAAFALWIELLLREAAVYVVVLMLPLAFAALAWPARRVWAVRGVEILVALILSKFAIVAVLSLGGSAIAASVGHANVSGLMAGTVLIMLAAVSPWTLLRFVPLAEVAASAAGALRADLRSTRASAETAAGYAKSGTDWIMGRAAELKREAAQRMAETEPPAASPAPQEPPSEAEPPVSSTPEQDPASSALEQAPRPAPAPADETSSTRQRRWADRPVLELGPGFGDTVVYPHPDAE